MGYVHLIRVTFSHWCLVNDVLLREEMSIILNRRDTCRERVSDVRHGRAKR